jgi:hypothetical protein
VTDGVSKLIIDTGSFFMMVPYHSILKRRRLQAPEIGGIDNE